MRQRGRQSGAGLGVIPPASPGPNLQPPRRLTATEARLFHEVVANAPPGQFSASDVYLLATFAQVTLLCERAARAAAKANDKNRQARFKMLDQAVKMQALLASKLRLATQSRIAPIRWVLTGSFSRMDGRAELSAIDRDALTRAMQLAQRDPLRAEHLASKLEDEPWAEVAEFAALSCQYDALSLKPWQDPPCVADEDDPTPRDRAAQTLLRRMLRAGVSRYDPR